MYAVILGSFVLAMIGCFIGAVIAGLFTLDPDRIIGGFFFGA